MRPVTPLCKGTKRKCGTETLTCARHGPDARGRGFLHRGGLFQTAGRSDSVCETPSGTGRQRRARGGTLPSTYCAPGPRPTALHTRHPAKPSRLLFARSIASHLSQVTEKDGQGREPHHACDAGVCVCPLRPTAATRAHETGSSTLWLRAQQIPSMRNPQLPRV